MPSLICPFSEVPWKRILRCWKWMPWSFLVWRPLQVSFCHKHFIFIIVGIISMFKFMKLFLITKREWTKHNVTINFKSSVLKKINKIRHFNVHIFFDIKHRSICVSFVVGLATASRRNEANVNIYLHLSDDEDPNYANSKIFLIHLHLCFSNRLLYNSIYSFSKSRQFITKSLTLTYLHHSEKKIPCQTKELNSFYHI